MSKIHLATKESALTDPSYRYQIDKLDIKAQGKQGNMTTYFLNSEEIASKISRSSKLFGKYISNSLSCPSGFDKEKSCLTFKGTYSYDQILKYFMEFVQVYVLCPICDYPEIQLYNQKDKGKKLGIYYHCESCGSDNLVNAKLDKTYEFIEKNI
jgi:translation initiation factor 5